MSKNAPVVDRESPRRPSFTGLCSLVSLHRHRTTPAPRAVDAWVFRVSLYGLQLARKMVFKFTKIAAQIGRMGPIGLMPPDGAGSEWA